MTEAPPRYDVTVVGGGISGLAAAFWLRQAGHRVLVLEKDAEAGGTMKSIRDGGYLVETGPNSALETTPLFQELFAACGLQDELEYANPVGKNRFIVRNGQMHPLPMSPIPFIRTPLFTWRGKLRLLAEPFIGRAPVEESIAQFVERRLGREFLDYAIDPFVAGVFAGKPEELSVRTAFPKLYALEEKYGGLIKGMIGGARERKKRAEKAKDRAESFSFRGGLQTLPAALARKLGDAVRVSAPVRSVMRTNDGYGVTFGSPTGTETVTSRALILAVPAFTAADLLAPLSDDVAHTLRSIEYSPVASVFLGYRRSDVDHPLNGFGVLIPRRENRRILGALWSSSLFPGRAPDGHAAFTLFVGGARQPEELERTDAELLSLCEAELGSIMHILGKPVYYRITRWEKAIPQYTLGYSRVIDALHAWRTGVPGLSFCSNYLGGISVGDCVMSARKTADEVGTWLRSPAP